MRSKFVLLVAAVAVCAFAAQDGQKFERKYKAGESDAYTMSMAMETGMGSIDVAMTMTQTIKKVFDNGDADIETSIGSMKINAMGNEMSPPTPPATTTRMNKRGVAVQAAQGAPAGGRAAGGMGMMLNFTRFGGIMTDGEMKVGAAVPFEDKESGSKGTVTLESLKDGVAVLVSKIEVKNPNGGAPMVVDTRSWIDSATSKLDKLEGTIKNPPGQDQMPIESIKMSMVRKK